MAVLLLPIALAAAQTTTAAVLTETFAQGRLDPSRWESIADGDFRQWAVDVVDVLGRGDFRLGLSADTRGTKDETVKFVGVRNLASVRLDQDVCVSVELDWNNQVNGSYLSAAVVLSPHVTIASPVKGPDWLKVEYIGVPPGKTARMIVGVKRGGQERTLYNEGWPESNRTGRTIGRQRLTIGLRDQALQVWENDRLVYDSKEKVVMFSTAYLYLQMSSHSNYPRRTIYFDNVEVDGCGFTKR